MKSIMRTLPLLAAIIFGACYNPDEQYTTIRSIDFRMEDASNIFADSISFQDVVIHLPGLRHKNPMTVKMTTTWGFWSNGMKETIANTNYDDGCDCFPVLDQLRPERTVTVFNVNVIGGDQTSSFYLESKPRYPDKVQLYADSTSMKNKLGNTTALKAIFYSTEGLVSYGLQFEFVQLENTTLLPVKVILSKGSFVQTQLVLTGSVGDPKLNISGTIRGVSPQPQFLPATILIKP